MKRDMDLIRDLLLEIEGGKYFFVVIGRGVANALAIPDDEAMDDDIAKQMEYHLVLLEDAGFVKFSRSGGGSWSCDGLTWKGQEFLEDIKDDIHL